MLDGDKRDFHNSNPRVNNLIDRYLKLLVESNRHISLVSRKGGAQLCSRLIEETLALFQNYSYQEGDKVFFKGELMDGPILDIGSGGGIPAIPMKILYPQLPIMLIESVRKKVLFLRWVVAELGLEGINVVWGRGEELAQNSYYRQYFGAITSRGAGLKAKDLTWLWELLKPGGTIWLWWTREIWEREKDRLTSLRLTHQYWEDVGIAMVKKEIEGGLYHKNNQLIKTIRK